MTSSCPDLSILETTDRPAGEERNRVLAHVASCGQCRKRLVEEDPTRLFALLALNPIPAKALDAVSQGVASRMTPAGTSPRRWATGAGWAAAAILSAMIVRILAEPLPPRIPGGTETAAVRAPRAEVEVIAPAGARQVVDLTVGDSQVVMIFDERVRL